MIKGVAERRSAIRAKRVLSIQFRLLQTSRKGATTEWHLSTTYDMSLGGIAFYTDQEFRTGDILEVEVVMSGILDIYKGLGRVVRVERKRGAAHYLTAIKLVSKKESRQAKSYISRTTQKKTARRAARRYH